MIFLLILILQAIKLTLIL